MIIAPNDHSPAYYKHSYIFFKPKKTIIEKLNDKVVSGAYCDITFSV